MLHWNHMLNVVLGTNCVIRNAFNILPRVVPQLALPTYLPPYHSTYPPTHPSIHQRLTNWWEGCRCYANGSSGAFSSGFFFPPSCTNKRLIAVSVYSKPLEQTNSLSSGCIFSYIQLICNNMKSLCHLCLESCQMEIKS